MTGLPVSFFCSMEEPYVDYSNLYSENCYVMFSFNLNKDFFTFISLSSFFEPKPLFNLKYCIRYLFDLCSLRTKECMSYCLCICLFADFTTSAKSCCKRFYTYIKVCKRKTKRTKQENKKHKL